MFVAHRINTSSELQNIPSDIGIEIDIRDTDTELYLSHDPFSTGELLDDFLKFYRHSFIILNIKSERIEHRIIELLVKYKITNYFFLDSSFPMIYNLSNLGENNIAVRFSEFEGLDTVINIKDRVRWVWVDCFSHFPLTPEIFKILKDKNLKICIVSPELQGQPNKISEYKSYMIDNHIKPDMICTKIYNIDQWKEIFN